MQAAYFHAILLLGAANLCRGDIAIISPPRLCTMEAVRVEWALTEWTGDPDLIWVEMHEVGRSPFDIPEVQKVCISSACYSPSPWIRFIGASARSTCISYFRR